MSLALKMENVNFDYLNNVRTLKNVNIEIPYNSFVGIIGPNGGGKTTLLRLIMGFLNPESGSIHVFNKSPADSRTHIAYVPQQLQLDRFFPMSLIEMVLGGCLRGSSLFGGYRKAEKLRARELLQSVGLGDYASRPLSELSGGQTQKALLARALISQPDLLLLDEPTASMDPKTRSDIYQMLLNLKGKMTVLMITHNLEDLIKEYDMILCVQGEVTELAPDHVCEHFAMGLYHPPLIKSNDSLGEGNE